MSQSSDSWLGFFILVAFVMIVFVIPFCVGLALRPRYLEWYRKREIQRMEQHIELQDIYQGMAEEAYENYRRKRRE